ncbi:MAG: SDR family oxidoreductase [Myxococcota bacterium]|nr:SDR family oxidoreductase [Myxococcota bacterium]
MKNLFDIEGKTALVTGGTRGIGLMIARGYVENGARVYVASRSEEACAETERELSKVGTCTAIAANLSTQEGCVALANEIKERESKLEILVNNAGANWGAPYEEFPAAAWDRVLDLNVKGPFFLTQALTPLLEAASKEDDPSRIINIGSIDGIQVPFLDTYSYSASKAAIHHMTRVLARKLAPKITVNAVAPGPFQSKMMKATLENFGDSIAEGAPMKRIGEPEDMAGVAIYLASRASSFVTGVILPVDGGIATTK